MPDRSLQTGPPGPKPPPERGEAGAWDFPNKDLSSNSRQRVNQDT